MRSAIALILLVAATPARAELVELFPTNKRAADGSYAAVLEVWRDRRTVVEFRSDRGEIDARTVRDRRAATAFVTQRFGLTPADRVSWCPNGVVRVTCEWPSTGR